MFPATPFENCISHLIASKRSRSTMLIMTTPGDLGRLARHTTEERIQKAEKFVSASLAKIALEVVPKTSDACFYFRELDGRIDL
jgi:hypothetical protein